MDRPKGGTSMSLPHDPCIQYLSPCSLTLQLDSNCLGFLFVFALKIGATYARLFLASRVESLFFLIFFLLFFFFIFLVLRFLCTFCIFFTSCLLLFFMLLLFSLSFFRDESCTRVVRQFELTLWGVRGVECWGGLLSAKRGTEDWGQSLNQ